MEDFAHKRQVKQCFLTLEPSFPYYFLVKIFDSEGASKTLQPLIHQQNLNKSTKHYYYRRFKSSKNIPTLNKVHFDSN